MNTLEYLNGTSSVNVSYTDNRLPNVIFDRASPVDYNFTELTQTFDIIVGAEIVDIINPAAANVRYKINVGSTDAVLNYSAFLPSGITVSQVGTVYTFFGIDSVDDWNEIKQLSITLTSGFTGSFSYSAAIVYDTIEASNIEFEWNVGIYVPASLMQTNVGINIDADRIRGVNSDLSGFFFMSRINAILAVVVTTDSEFSLTASGDRKFVLLSPATSSINYTTSTDFALSGTPLIVGPNQQNMTMTITPSTTSAINTISEDPPATISTHLTFNDPTTSSARWGDARTFAATVDYVAIADRDFSGTDYVRLYSLGSGNLLRSHADSYGRILINDTNYYVQEHSSGSNKLIKITDGTVTNAPGSMWGMTNTHYAFYGGSGVVIREISSGTDIITVAGGQINTAGKILSDNYAVITTGTAPSYTHTVYDLSTGNSVRSFNINTNKICVNDNYLVSLASNDINVYNLSTGSLHTSFDISIPTGYSRTAFEIHMNEDGLIMSSEKAFNSSASTYYSRWRILDPDYEQIVYEQEANDTVEQEQITTGVYINNEFAVNGNYHNDQIIVYDIAYTPITTINPTTKVITLSGSRDDINTRLEFNRITITPSTGYSSSFTLSYKGTRDDGKESDIETQNVIN